jgi:hypothetical protein
MSRAFLSTNGCGALASQKQTSSSPVDYLFKSKMAAEPHGDFALWIRLQLFSDLSSGRIERGIAFFSKWIEKFK